MPESHVTFKVPKNFLLIGIVAVLMISSFFLGMAVSGGESDTLATTTSTELTATSSLPSTTVATSTTVKKSTPKTTVKKTPVAPLAVDITYADTCLPTTSAGALGTMTLTWTSTSAVRVRVQVQHGSDYSSDTNVLPNDSMRIERPCNNDNGLPRPVAYLITAFDADGNQLQDGGNDSM